MAEVTSLIPFREVSQIFETGGAAPISISVSPAPVSPSSSPSRFIPSSPATGVPGAETILTRHSFFDRPYLNPRQAAAESVFSRVHDFVLSPRGYGLFFGGQIAWQMGRAIAAAPEIQMALSALSSAPRWRVAALAFPAMAGCSGGGWDSDAGGSDARRPDGSLDGGVPRDNDGDGYNSNIDCDDGNPTIHPLPSVPGLTTINTSTTVCPGIYRGLNIVIAPGTSAITVTGTGVTLDGEGSLMPAYQLNMVSNITLEGFNIVNYPLGAAVILLNDAHNNTFRNMTVEAPQNRYAFFLDNSDGNRLDQVTINSHSDVAIQVNSSEMFTMTSSTVNGTPPFDGVPAFGLLTIDGGAGHRIENNMFLGGSRFGLELFNLTGTMVTGNRIQTNANDGIRTSSMRTTTLSGNIVTGNGGWALNLTNGSTMNTVTNNNFTMNTSGAVTNDVSSATGNTFSGNTPAP